MDKKTRTYEEIITLQDKAIEALTQANAALVMALEALKKARAEHGFPAQLPGFGTLGGLGQGSGYVANKPVYVNPVYVPNTTDGIQWGGQTGLVTVTNTTSMKTETAKSLIAQATQQAELAQAYIAAYGQKEQDAFSEVGGCI
jgi:hypothetical protein